ncbi:MAG: hypothetical protein IGS39_02335 [Calothrix sp. C42_A2020_038]|nr:hypothetical protein [Calothrix sp. C42_A2020_038]
MISIKTVEKCMLKLYKSSLFLLTCACFLTIISFQSPILLFCLLLTGAVTAYIQYFGKCAKLPTNWIIILQTLVVVVILSGFWLDWFANPAAAQFFSKAEIFFKNNLADASQSGATNAVSLVFNVIRALYLLYIAVSLVGVVNAVRKDEDWQVVARTPLLVVIAVTIADVLTSFITG